MKKEHLETNCETLEGQSFKVDREHSVIKGAKLLGFHSRNGRTYPPSVARAAVHHYEGVMVNLDHPQKATDPRSVLSRLGVIRNAHFVEGSGVHGDFHYNPKHPAMEQVLWDAENNPSAVGFSHNANLSYSVKTGKMVVEAVAGVRSVDLVANPATTNGIFEHDLGDEGHPTEGKEMSLKEMTMEQILAERPDLKELVQVKEGETLEALKQELAELKAENVQRERVQALEAELVTEGLVGDRVSPAFKSVYMATESADLRKELRAERVALTKAPSEAAKGKAKTTAALEGSEAPKELTPEAFVRALRTK